MPWIRFTEHRLVRDGSGREFHPGDVVELREPSCRHWLNRGVAVRCEAPVVEVPEPEHVFDPLPVPDDWSEPVAVEDPHPVVMADDVHDDADAESTSPVTVSDDDFENVPDADPEPTAKPKRRYTRRKK